MELTQHDFFAGMAMQGLLAKVNKPGYAIHDADIKQLVGMSMKLADEMAKASANWRMNPNSFPTVVTKDQP